VDTGMVYKPRRYRPTDEEIELLVEYFYGK
jgi:hypothetical protein